MKKLLAVLLFATLSAAAKLPEHTFYGRAQSADGNRILISQLRWENDVGIVITKEFCVGDEKLLLKIKQLKTPVSVLYTQDESCNHIIDVDY